MKFRMLILAALMMVFAATSFGQSNVNFLWAEGFNPNWTPLTMCEEGDYAGTILEEGTRVILYKSASAFTPPNPATDVPAVVGHNGAAGEIWPSNEIFFETPPNTDAPGFYATSYQFEGGTPGSFDLFYLVVCCDDQTTGECTPIFYSSRFSIGIGYIEVIVGAADPVLGYTGFERLGCCEPSAQPCVPSADWHFEATGMNYHGDEDYYPNNEYFCLDICTDHTINLEIGPLAANEYPVINILEGCDIGCEVVCDAATVVYDDAAWVHNASNNMWTNTVVGLSDGCICLELDDILPAELLGFTAKAGDKEVALNWSTASETDIDGFEVVRDGDVVHFADAAGNGASYTWMDSDLNNGRTYSYELVSVSITGTRTVVGTTEATPSFNAATITEYALHQNFPNPFNPTTSIVFDVVESNHVTLTVYNAMGQEVSTLVNGIFNNGRHNVEFSSDNLTSGLYFYTVKIGNEFTATKKMLLVK